MEEKRNLMSTEIIIILYNNQVLIMNLIERAWLVISD